jgi:hypothetical protein
MINSLKELNRLLDFISYFRASFPEVTKFHFYIYKPHLGAAAQLVASGKEVPNLFAERKWQFEKKVIEAVRNNSTHESHITNMLRHDPKESDSLICVEANDLETWLLKTLDKIEEDEAIGWTSLCIDSVNKFCHLPMMDFSCDVSLQNLAFIKKAMEFMGEKKGIFVNSGNSYHYYGLSVIPTLQWHHFMTQCILLGPFTDVRYIAHRLLSGYCILRISPSRLKQKIPQIVDYLD